MFKLISLLRDRIHREDLDFYTLPFPGFVMDTRSSPLEVRYELDVRNDQHRATWSKRWRTLAFNEGRYGQQLVEESVGAPRALAPVEPRPLPTKVHHLNGALAA